MNNKSDKIIFSILLIGLIGMIIGSMYDLEINKILYMRGSVIPNTFKIFGEFPMIILISTTSLIYIRHNLNKKKTFMFYFMILLFIGFPIGSAIGIPRYFNTNNIFYSLLIFILYISLSYILSKYLLIDKKYSLNKYIIFIVFTILAIFVFYNILKNIWGRGRFFPMFEKNNFSDFTNWWIINGRPTSDLFRSFPSGHTSAAATTLVLLYIPINEDIKFNRWINIIFPIFWTFTVAISRILDGAHYLTDVSFAIVLSVTIIFIMKKFYLSTNSIYNI